MTLDQLRIFVAVAEHQHVTRAAAALNMTQSAVSAAILALEQRHAVALFDRVGRSIHLNQTGRVFLERARRVLAEAHAAETALDDLAGLRRGTLSVMASQTIAAYWLPARLAAFHLRHPHISFDIRIGNTEMVADAVEAGLVEIGLVEGTVERPVLSSRVVDVDEMMLAAHPDNPLLGKGTARGTAKAAQLRQGAWVLREEGSGTRLAFEALIAAEGLTLSDLDIVMVLPSNEAVLGAVEAGVGMTLTSRSVAATRLAAGLLGELPFPPVPRPFHLIRHRDRYRSKAGETFEASL